MANSTGGNGIVLKIRNKYGEIIGLDIEFDSLVKQIQEQLVEKLGNTDIEITNSAKGVIFTDSDGVRWRQTINTSGVVVITELT